MSLTIYLTSKQSCPHCGHIFGDGGESIHSQNITHNLGGMAREAGIYELLWRPEGVPVINAGQLVAPLEKAITDMKADSERFKKHNASNGWGMYENFLPWLERLLEACKANPGAVVESHR